LGHLLRESVVLARVKEVWVNGLVSYRYYIYTIREAPDKLIL
jgi:hypothetical protein